jgi:peptidoglycan/LPS O-acetylase OafA/YrhL
MDLRFNLLISVSHIYFWRTANYFSPASEGKPFLNNWLLPVEKQFYFIFPIAGGLLCAYRVRRWIKMLEGIGAGFLAIAGGVEREPVSRWHL